MDKDVKADYGESMKKLNKKKKHKTPISDSKEMEKIYDENRKIELRHSLKSSPPIASYIAKKLINNSKRALAIVEKYYTAKCEKDLRDGIQRLEDELAENGEINVLTYNLEVRNYIHISMLWVNRWTKKDEDESSTN